MKGKKAMERLHKNKQSHILIAIIFFVVLFMAVSVTEFYTDIKAEKVNFSDIQLMNLARSNVSSTKIFFEGQQSALRAIALSLERYDDLTSNEVILYLDSTAKALGYDRLAIDFPDGSSYTSDGHVFDASNMGFVDRVKNGETFISNIRIAIADGEQVIGIFSPIYRNGKPIASLRCAVNPSTISEKIGINFFNDEEYFRLIDDNGDYVSGDFLPNSLLVDGNFFVSSKNFEYEKNYSHQKFMDDTKAKKSGYIKYSFDENRIHAYYFPVGINNWTMMTIKSSNIVENSIRQSLYSVVILLLKIMFTVAILFGYIFWVQKRANRKATLDEKCFRVLSEQIGNVIFEWNFSEGRIANISNFKNVFGRDPYTITSPNEAISANAIYFEDLDKFNKLFNDILSGKNIRDVKFRMRSTANDFIWCSISGVVINDSRNKPYKAIGFVKNIDEEEKEAQILKDKAQKDLLTNLYNKISTEVLITEYTEENIEKNGNGALFMIDLDNFKGVNDNLGHQFGDTVLVDIAIKLKKIFRSSDIIGRIGGDEFVVFMKDVTSIDIVKDRAKNICNDFAQTFTGEKKEYRLSASVGIAMYPQHGNNFNELYRLADFALYNAKHNGKNIYTIYNIDIIDKVDKTNKAKDIEKPFEDVERFIANHFAGDHIHNIFEMLYETKDIQTTINMIMGIIGKRYNVDRCYIFETNEKNTLLSNTYEWCSSGINPEIDSLKNIPIENMNGFFSNYNDDGIFYCNDLSTLDEFSYETLSRQGIKSLLHCAIFDGNLIRGIIGFDECKATRVWSGEEIANLGYISQILSIFIIKRQISDELRLRGTGYAAF